MSHSQPPEIHAGTTASRSEPAPQRGGRDNSPASTTTRLRRWFLQRGVLFVLTQTPMIALMVGFIFKWISYPLATVFFVLPTVILLPAWILYRRRVSSDLDEPANQFPRLALWAVFPVIAFDLARIPMHYALGNVFWGTWFDFGSSLTGQPPSHWPSLLAGTFLHIFQGYVLALGYYILFRRASLLSALGYLFVLLSVIYSWQFPRYVILGPTPFKWYFVIWWAHLWFALTAWAVPRLDTARLRERLHHPAFAWTAGVVAVALAAAPFSFVFWRVDTWQFPRQDATDSGAFTHLALAPNPGIVVMAADTFGEAVYRMTFRLGPRDYKNFMGTAENLGAGTLRITGDITDPDGPIAFCADTIPTLPSAAALATPATFAADVRQMDFTNIPVTCVGPAASLAALVKGPTAAGVQLRWTATVTMDADRDSAPKSFAGSQAASLAER
jgi:hypothetical protein